MAKQLNIDLMFNANTEQAENSIKSLQESLFKLATTKAVPGVSTENLKAASKAAQELSIHLRKAYNADTGKLDLSKLDKSLNASKKTLTQYSQELLRSGQIGHQAFTDLAVSISKADRPLLAINAKLKEFSVVMKNTVRWQISSSVLHGLMGTMQGAMRYAKDLNESLNNIRIVTGYSANEMASFAKEANKAAKSLNTTTTAYTDASLIYYQQGLNKEQVKERTDITIKMANVARESGQVVSDQMTAVWNNFAKGGENLEYYADVMTALGAATASSTSEISEGLQKFAAIADTVGLSYEYSTAALATVTSTTRQSADIVGTAFKTMFARIQGLKLGEVMEDGTDLNKYSEALANVGVNIKDNVGNLKDMDVILDEVAGKWKVLSKDEKTALAQTVAGTRQYTQLVALMDNWDFMEDNLEVARNSKGALSEQAAIYAESWEAARKEVRSSLESLYTNLVDDTLFIKLNKGLAGILDTINAVVEGIGGLKPILISLGSFFLSSVAQKIKPAIDSLIHNVTVLFRGADTQAAKISGEMNAGIDRELAKKDLSFTQKQQLEGAKALNEAKAKYFAIQDSMTNLEKEQAESELARLNIQNEKNAKLAEEYESQKKIYDLSKSEFNDSLSVISENFGEKSNKFSKKAKAARKELETTSLTGDELTDLQNRKESLESSDEAVLLNNNNFVKKLGETLINQTDADIANGKGETFDTKANPINFTAAEIIQDQLDSFASTESSIYFSSGTEIKEKILPDLQKSAMEIQQSFGDMIPADLDKSLQSVINQITKMSEAEKITAEDSLRLGETLTVFTEEAEKTTFSAKEAKKILTLLGMGIDVKGLVEQGKKLGLTAKEMVENTLAAKKALENFNPGHKVGGVESLTLMASTIGQIASTINGIKSIGNIWNNEDISTGQKILGTLTSVSFTIPSLLNLLKNLKTVTGLTNFAVSLGSMKEKIEGLSGVTEILNGVKAEGNSIDLKSESIKGINKVLDEANYTATQKATAQYIILKKAKQEGIKVSWRQIAAAKMEAIATNENNTALTRWIATKIQAIMLAKAGALIGLGLALAAVVGLTIALATQIKTLKKRHEQMKKDVEAYREAAQEVDNLKSSIQSLEEKIDELKSKGPLTLIEQSELQKSESELALLKNQLAVAKEIQKVKLQNSIDSFKDVGFSYFDGSTQVQYTDYSTMAGSELPVNIQGTEIDTRKTSLYNQMNKANLIGVNQESDLTVKKIEELLKDPEFLGDSSNGLLIDQLKTFKSLLEAEAQFVVDSAEETKQKIAENPDDFAAAQEAYFNYVQNTPTDQIDPSYVIDYNNKLRAVYGNDYDKHAQDTVLGFLSDAGITREKFEDTTNPEEIRSSLKDGLNDFQKINIFQSGMTIDEYLDRAVSYIANGIVDSHSANTSAENTASKIKETNSELKKLKTGDTISSTQYFKDIDDNLKKYFQLTEDGQYKLIGNAENFKKELDKLTFDNIKNSIEDVKKVQDEVEAKQNNYNNFLSGKSSSSENKSASEEDESSQQAPWSWIEKIPGEKNPGEIQNEAKASLGLTEDNNKIAQDVGNAIVINTSAFGVTSNDMDNSDFIASQVGKAEQRIKSALGEEALEEIKGNIELFDKESGGYTAEGINALAEKSQEAAQAMEQSQSDLDAANEQLVQAFTMQLASETTLSGLDSSSSAINNLISEEDTEMKNKSLEAERGALKLIAAQYAECTDELVAYNTALADGTDEQKVEATKKLRKEIRRVEWKHATKDILKYSEALNTATSAEEIEDNLAGIAEAFNKNLGTTLSTEDLEKYREDLIKWGQAAEEDTDDIMTNIYSRIMLEENQDKGFSFLSSLIGTDKDGKELINGEDVANTITQEIDQIQQIIKDNPITVDANGNADFSQLMGALLDAQYSASEVAGIIASMGQTNIEFGGEALDLNTAEGIFGLIASIKEWQGVLGVKDGDIPDGGWVAQAKMKRLTGSGGGRRYGKKSKGGSKPKKVKLTEEKDVVKRYKEIDDTLDDIRDALEEVNKQEDRMYGASRIKQMEAALKILKEEEKSIEKKMELNRQYLEKDLKALGDASATIGIDFELDEKGNIKNYTSIMESLYSELHQAEVNANADGNATEVEQDVIDRINKKIEIAKKAIDQYDETREMREDLAQELLDKKFAQQDKNAEILEYKLEMHIELEDIELETVEHQLSLIEDDIYKMGEGAALTASKLRPSLDKLEENEKTLKALDEAYKNNEISQSKYIEMSKEIKNNMQEEIETLNDLKNEMIEYYGNTLSMAREEIEKYTNSMEDSLAVLEHYKSILELIGEDIDFEKMDLLISSQSKIAMDKFETSLETFKILQEEVEKREKAIEQAKNELATMTEGTDEYEAKKEEIEQLKELRLQALEQEQELQDEMFSNAESALEYLGAKLENSLEQAKKKLEDALTGGKGFEELNTNLERANSLQEEFLTTTNKVYETNKLMNKIQDDIDKTSNKVAKAKLKAFQEETKKMQEQKKLSKFELDLQQKKYDLLLAEIALKEAQEAKTQVRLSRDSEGNFSYVYTADEDAIADAQQKYDDANNSIYNAALEGGKKYSEQFIHLQEELTEKLAEINSNKQLSEEERQRQSEETIKYYEQMMGDSLSLFQIAMEQDGRIVDGIWQGSIDIMEEAGRTWIRNSEGMMEASAEWKDAVSQYLLENVMAWDSYNADIEKITEPLGTNLEDLTNKTHNLTQENHNLKDEIQNELLGPIEEEINEVSALTEEFIKENSAVKDLIETYEELIQKLQKKIVLEIETPKVPPIVVDVQYNYGDVPKGENKLESDNKNTDGNGGGNGGGKSMHRAGLYSGRMSSTLNWEPALYYNNEPYYEVIVKGEKYYFKKSDIDSRIDKKYGTTTVVRDMPQYQYYDTGGYTGEWGPQGKLAVLHEKELILNKMDTANLLDTIKLTDKIVNAINLQASMAENGIGLPTIGRINPSQILGNQQDITIYADFPDVENYNEIKLAFNSLLNEASQFANRKK